MKRLLVFALLAVAAAASTVPQRYVAPQFIETPAQRRDHVRAVTSEIDQVFKTFAAERHTPGLVWGIVLDGDLVHAGATGFANVERKIPANADTRFRIASMSKSFTALAVLKLRDAGKLSLQDSVGKFLPEFRAVAALTRDSPAITIRHLLTMTPGFPEDNPWGDRQLAVSVKDFSAFVSRGVSLANAPGVAFEYSNLAFALLGQIVARVTGESYQAFITREILQPLGLKDTRWEFADVPPDKLALGYRWEDNAWRPEPLLHDGTYGAMGGLLTTLNDFARYVSFHLSAWPPRDDAESAVAARASLREMHKMAEFTGVSLEKSLGGESVPQASGYGYGLGCTIDHQGVMRVAHSGGLPGFGSNYRFYPEHGVAIISFANLTYAGTGAPNAKAAALLIEKARLPRRGLPPSALLTQRSQQLADLLQSWEPSVADAILAENFFLDRSREAWRKQSRETLERIGRVKSVGEVVPENQLRGTFPLVGEKGRVDVFFTLTPEQTPRVQQLRLTVARR